MVEFRIAEQSSHVQVTESEGSAVELSTTTSQDISLHLYTSDVKLTRPVGHDLHIELHNGDVFIIEEFCHPVADGGMHRVFFSNDGEIDILKTYGNPSLDDVTSYLVFDKDAAGFLLPGGFGSGGGLGLLASGLAGLSWIGADSYGATNNTSAPEVPEVIASTVISSTPVITGTAVLNDGDVLSVEVNGETYTDGDGNLVTNEDGTWELTIPAGSELPDGDHEVIATVTDADGNTSMDTSTNEITVDTTAPEAPTVTAATVSDNTPVITGTAMLEDGDVLTVQVNGVVYTVGDGNLVDNGDGTWELTIPDSDALPEGTFEVIAVVTDPAGHATTDASVNELVIDTVSPAAPTIDSDNVSNATPVITGTAVVGVDEILTVEVGGVTYTAGEGDLVDNGDGTWTLMIPAGNPLADGTHDVVATVTDTAGNWTADATTGEVTIDTVAPNAPTITAAVTNDDTPVISGTATVGTGETLTVEVGGVTYTAGDGDLVDNGDGTWNLTIPSGNELPEGTYEVTATVTDGAGNATSDVSVNEVQIDMTAPTAPTIDAVNTNDSTPVITGTATVGTDETLTVSVDGITYTAGDGSLVDNGDGTWALTIPAGDTLADGTYEIVATVTDLAGNSSSDGSLLELTIDTGAPTAPTVDAGTTNDDTPIITGTATVQSGDTLTVEVNGVTYTAGDGNLVDNGNGTWALTVPAGNELPDGSFDVTATVTDSVGNSSTDATAIEITVDTVAPGAPAVVDAFTVDSGYVIFGTATVAAGETLTVTLDGVTFTAGDGVLVDNGDGTWDLNLPGTVVLPDGTYEITATIIDAAGNAASDPTSNELVVDTVAPGAPSVDALTTSDDTPVITGTATVGIGETLTVEVNGVTFTAGDGHLVDSGSGTWTLTVPAGNALPDGTYNVVATVTDSSGNASSDASSNELIVDTTAPGAPTVDTLSTSDSTPVITGDALLSAGETLTVNVNGVTYTAGDGNLVHTGETWALTIPAGNELADGTYNVAATIADAAGNATSDPSSSELVIDTTAPAAPTVDALSTNDTTPVLTGTATVGTGETLTVVVDGVTYTAGTGPLVDNGNGTWTLTIPAGDALTAGTYEVVATVMDAVGNNASDTSVNELVIDTSGPSAPTIDYITRAESGIVTISGTGEAGATVTVTFPDGSNATAVVLGDGSFGPVSSATAQSAGNVTANQVDTFGNASVGPDASANVIINSLGAASMSGTGDADVLDSNGTTGTMNGGDGNDELRVSFETTNAINNGEFDTTADWTINNPTGDFAPLIDNGALHFGLESTISGQAVSLNLDDLANDPGVSTLSGTIGAGAGGNAAQYYFGGTSDDKYVAVDPDENGADVGTFETVNMNWLADFGAFTQTYNFGNVSTLTPGAMHDGVSEGLAIRWTDPADFGNRMIEFVWNGTVIETVDSGYAISIGGTGFSLNISQTGLISFTTGFGGTVTAQIPGTEWDDTDNSGWQFAASATTPGSSNPNDWIRNIRFSGIAEEQVNNIGDSVEQDFTAEVGVETVVCWDMFTEGTGTATFEITAEILDATGTIIETQVTTVTSGSTETGYITYTPASADNTLRLTYSDASGDTGSSELVLDKVAAYQTGMVNTLDGGSGDDTLTVFGSDIVLDLTEIDDADISNIERIDITGTGDNTLILDASDLIAASSTSDTLMVLADAGDTIEAAGFTAGGTQAVDGQTYDVYTSGGGTLLVDEDATVVV